MLMRTKETVDYCYVAPEHEAIHARLNNWARWVRVHPNRWPTHPMWRLFQSKARQWSQPAIPVPVNTLDAADMEKAVYALPVKHREAIRWSYVYGRDPVAMARTLGVSKQGLADLVDAGRTMLRNRLQP